MHEITEQDLFNALRPYYPVKCYYDLVKINQLYQQQKDVLELKSQRKTLNSRVSELKKSIKNLEKERLKRKKAIEKEEEKEFLTLNLPKRIAKFKSVNNVNGVRLSQLLKIPVQSLFTIENGIHQKSKYLGKIDKFLAKHGF